MYLYVPVDVVEDDDAFLFFADVPGISKRDIKVHTFKRSAPGL
jgi:HSP20 family molecular chaperone IbpA